MWQRRGQALSLCSASLYAATQMSFCGQMLSLARLAQKIPFLVSR